MEDLKKNSGIFEENVKEQNDVLIAFAQRIENANSNDTKESDLGATHEKLKANDTRVNSCFRKWLLNWR